jgi:hypothetical protein
VTSWPGTPDGPGRPGTHGMPLLEKLDLRWNAVYDVPAGLHERGDAAHVRRRPGGINRLQCQSPNSSIRSNAMW